MNVRLTPIAKDDIARLYRWYEARRDRLGSYEIPYALWYTVEPDETIVIGCLHGRRDRMLAKERALGVIPFSAP